MKTKSFVFNGEAELMVFMVYWRENLEEVVSLLGKILRLGKSYNQKERGRETERETLIKTCCSRVFTETLFCFAKLLRKLRQGHAITQVACFSLEQKLGRSSFILICSPLNIFTLVSAPLSFEATSIDI